VSLRPFGAALKQPLLHGILPLQIGGGGELPSTIEHWRMLAILSASTCNKPKEICPRITQETMFVGKCPSCIDHLADDQPEGESIHWYDYPWWGRRANGEMRQCRPCYVHEPAHTPPHYCVHEPYWWLRAVASPPLPWAVICLKGKVPNEYDYPDGKEEGRHSKRRMNVVGSNSNRVHKALDGHETFIDRGGSQSVMQ
jgi:hypothetical protein